MLLIQVTSSHGPAECEIAAKRTLDAMISDAAKAKVAIEVIDANVGSNASMLRSALVEVRGDGAMPWARAWLGTVQWVFDSPVRPGHKRKNWFVGVNTCQSPSVIDLDAIEKDLVFSACRASGKGGQHVNTTDSAVRCVHTPTGLQVRVETERSQHMNKKRAKELIAHMLEQRNLLSTKDTTRANAMQHWQVERGNAVKKFVV